MPKFVEIKPSTFYALKPRRRVTRFFIHCSAADNDSDSFKGPALSKTINRWHRERGWSGIGYHFTIDKDGRLMTGRSLEKTPAAQAGNNAGTLTVCLHGLDIDKFTAPQLKTLQDLCIVVNKAYDSMITFHGHCEVSAKSCPVIDYKTLLQLDKHGNLGI